MACHYEIKVGRYVFCEDLINHAQEEKENLLGGCGRLTGNLLTRAVYEVFGVSVKKSRKRSNEGATMKKCFNNLIKKTHSSTDRADEDGGLQQKWEKLRLNISEVINAVDGEWRSMSSENSISCLRFDESLRCDGRRAVYEVIFRKNESENKLETEMLYDQRHVSPEMVRQVDVLCSEMNIIEKAKQYLTVFEKSYWRRDGTNRALQCRGGEASVHTKRKWDFRGGTVLSWL